MHDAVMAVDQGPKFEELYREREPHYGKAHLMVDTVGQTTDQVIGRILASLRASHAARV